MITDNFLVKLHEQEDSLNREMSKNNNIIEALRKKNNKIKKQISKNMLLRNRVINNIYSSSSK